MPSVVRQFGNRSFLAEAFPDSIAEEIEAARMSEPTSLADVRYAALLDSKRRILAVTTLTGIKASVLSGEILDIDVHFRVIGA